MKWGLDKYIKCALKSAIPTNHGSCAVDKILANYGCWIKEVTVKNEFGEFLAQIQQ